MAPLPSPLTLLPRFAFAALLASTLVACGEDRTPLPGGGGGGDASTAADGGTASDAGATDGGADAPDSGGGATDGGGGATDAGGGATDAGSAAAIEVPVDVWTWVDFPSSRCDDGSPTGLGVRRGANADTLLLFLNGGGACWDALTCFVLNTSTKGPFGAPEFAALGDLDIGIFRRSDRANVFRDAHYVFVPYCTGDVHAGQNDASYATNGGMRTVNHRGHTNMLAYIARLRATFPDVAKVVVSGSSAGGFGAAFNYLAVRGAWPQAKVYLVDDSGPPLVGETVPSFLIDAWYDSWKIGDILDGLCGAACKRDLSLTFSALATIYPNDRLALLSSLQDEVIRNYFTISGPQFESGLRRLATEVLDPQPNFKYFFVTGSSHTMLGSPAQFTTGGVNLQTWLEQQIDDDPAWRSVAPTR
jgi:hypothetical protein